jgi:hypothetical protein
MTPEALNLAVLAVDTAISLYKKILADSGMTAEEAQAHAAAQDTQNLADIQALIAK